MSYSIPLHNMSKEQVTDVYDELLTKLLGIPMEENQMRYLLIQFTEMLDETGDMFGPAGWRHYFRLED